MANTIPCPNPVCTHQFGLAELQAAAQLLCPKCGFRMKGKGAPKPAPVAPTKPAATPKPAGKATAPAAAKPKPAPPKPTQPVQAPKLATPVAAQPKLASPVSAAPMAPLATPVAPSTGGDEASADGMFFNPAIGAGAGTLVRTTGKPKRKFNWTKFLIMVLAVGLAASIVIGSFVGALRLFFGDGAFRELSAHVPSSIVYGQVRGKNGLEKIYKLVLLKEDWEVDKEVRSQFEAKRDETEVTPVVAAWKHKQYDFWFAVIVQDYGVFKPRDAEMLRAGLEKLENVFGTDLEVGKKAEPAKIGDKAAQKIEFKGQIKGGAWSGDCYMFFNNGIAYWLYIASPDKGVVAYFAAELPEKNFFVESERRDWREQPAPMETFASVNAKLTVTVPKEVWERHGDPKKLDDNGVLYLSGIFRKEKDNRKNASLLIFTFANKGDLKDAMKKAREYLASKAKQDNEDYKLELATEVTAGQTDIGAQGDVGDRKGRMIDLKRLFNDEPQRYYLLAVVNEADTAYGIQCECAWESRQIWRQDFLDVMRTMKFKTKE